MTEKEVTTTLGYADRVKMFGALYVNELRKLAARKRYIVFFIIGVAICLANFGIKLLINFLTAQGTFEYIFKIESMSFGMLGFLTDIFVPFISFLAISDLIGSEYQSGSIRAILMRPVTRSKIYFSKIMAAFTICAVNYFGIYAVTVILDVIIGNISGADFAYSLGIYVIDIIPIFTIVLLGAFINSLCKKSGMSVFICIAIYVVLKIGGIFMPSISGLLFTGYTKWHTLWIGAALPFNAMLSKIMLIFGYSIVFASGGYYIFLRTDF